MGTSKKLVDTTSVRGKQGYRAPELLTDKGYNNKSDIWSFGCVVCELFSGRKAFSNDLEVWDLAKQSLSGTPRDPFDDRDELTKHYISGLFEINRENRPSARTLLEDKFFTETPSVNSPETVRAQKRRRTSFDTNTVAASTESAPSSLLRETLDWAVSKQEIDMILVLVEAGVKPGCSLDVYHMLDAFVLNWNQSTQSKFQSLINLCPSSFWRKHVPGYVQKEEATNIIPEAAAKIIRKARSIVFGEDETVLPISDTSWSMTENEQLHGNDWYAISVRDLFKLSLFHTERLHYETLVNCVQFSEDGRYLAVHGDMVSVYEVHIDSHAAVLSLDAISDLIGPDKASCLQFTYDSSRLVVAYQNGLISLWNLVTREKELLFEPRTSPITAMDVSRDDSRLVGVSEEKFTLWSLETGKIIGRHSSSGKLLRAVAISMDGQFALAGDQQSNKGYIWHFDPRSGENQLLWGNREEEIWGHQESITSIACSHTNQGEFITGSLDNTVKLWMLQSPKQQILGFGEGPVGFKFVGPIESNSTFTGHDNLISTVAFSPDDRWIISGSTTGSVRIWDVTDGTLVLLLNAHGTKG